jgi:diadenylate cyclase
MPQLLDTIAGQVSPTTLVDIGITALVIYWLFSLIRGTRAVRLVIGVSVILAIYAIAQATGLRLFTQLLQAGAVVGLFALVVVFQPELRRGLDRIGRVGSLAWLQSPADQREAERVAAIVARAAARLSQSRFGALMVIERETGLEEIAETGVMIHGDLSSDLLEALFFPRSALHDGAVIIREGGILAAGAVLPLAEISLQSERFGTRHRAALGITEATDAIVVVVSEETGQASLVERARIRRNLDEGQLAQGIIALLAPGRSGRAALRDRLSAARSRPHGAPSPGTLRRAALGDLRRRAQRQDEPTSPVVSPTTEADVPAVVSGRRR